MDVIGFYGYTTEKMWIMTYFVFKLKRGWHILVTNQTEVVTIKCTGKTIINQGNIGTESWV